MRRWIPIALMVVGLAAGVTSAQAQSRMTFQCHNGATAPCVDGGRFVLSGRESFLLGVYDSGFSTPPASWGNALFTGTADIRYNRELGDIPINAYLNYYQGLRTSAEIETLLNALSAEQQRRSTASVLAAPIMWFQTANCSGDGSYTRYAFSVDNDTGFASAVAKHPNMAGYYVMDECGDSSYGTNLVPETQDHYEALNALDPAAIKFAVPVARGYRDPNFWIAPPYGDSMATNEPTADLFGTDPYPMYNSEPRTGYPHFEVADYIARLREDVTKATTPSNGKPVVAVLQFFKFGNAGRLPTKAEMRMHAYAAIVEGAQGLFWWDIGENGIRKSTMKTSQISAAMQNLREVVNELKWLEPALLATPTPGMLIDVTPKSASARDWRIAALQTVIPLISNYADKQWYQAELNSLTNTMAPPYPLSPMLNQASPQKSNIRTRVSFLNGVGYIIIAYNYGNTAIKGATFTWQSNLQSVSALREGPNQTDRPITIPSNSATFKDDFAPYEAHVYIVH